MKNERKEWVAVPETPGLIPMEITEAPPIEMPRTKILCNPDTHCPTCSIPLIPEHAHMKCPKCHYRDSCCF